MAGDGLQIDRLEQRVRQLLLLQEAVKKVNSILDLGQLLDEIVGSVAENFGCTTTAILLKDDASEELEVFALRGFSDLRKGTRFKIGSEGMVGHVSATGEMRYAPDVRLDPYYADQESTTRSEVDIPLITRSKVIGVLDAQSSSLNGFSPEQIELLCALADNVAIAVENARLFRQERLEKERALREQDEARRIQRALLPDVDPEIPGYAIDGVCLERSAVGGDWYDYLPLDTESWGLALGDVCGKGMAAALLMAATRSLLRRAGAATRSPSEVLTKLNEAIMRDMPEGTFVTIVYGVLEVKTGVVTLANAGHPAPLVVESHSEAKPLQTAEGYPLGMMVSRYSEVQTQLGRGDRLLMYSDGLVEASSPSGEEYGTSRLVNHLRMRNACAKNLLADVQRFTHGCMLADDATAIVARRT
jgi:phosphoserine phosphatase RsbU/P